MNPIYRPLPNLLLRKAARPFASFLPEKYLFPVTGSIEVSPPEGERFQMSCNPTSYLCKALFWGGCEAFEPELLDVFRAVARSSRFFVDVGANIGYYGLLAAAYNSEIEVVAFEPSPDPFAQLLRNAALNGRSNITAVPMALGEKQGRIVFYQSKNPKYPDIPQLGSTGSADPSQASSYGEAARVEVEIDTLDAYLARARPAGFPPVGMMKVDVEGAEVDVLRGSAKTLDRDRPVVLFEALGRDRAWEEACSIFEGHSYTLFVATPNRLVPVNEAKQHQVRSTNYIGVASEQVSRWEWAPTP